MPQAGQCGDRAPSTSDHGHDHGQLHKGGEAMTLPGRNLIARPQPDCPPQSDRAQLRPETRRPLAGALPHNRCGVVALEPCRGQHVGTYCISHPFPSNQPEPNLVPKKYGTTHKENGSRRPSLRQSPISQLCGYVGEQSSVEGAWLEEEKSSCSKRAILALLSFSFSVSRSMS